MIESSAPQDPRTLRCDFPTDAYMSVPQAQHARTAHHDCDPAACTTRLRAAQILEAAASIPAREPGH